MGSEGALRKSPAGSRDPDVIRKEAVPSTAWALSLGLPRAPIALVPLHPRRGSHHAGLWPGQAVVRPVFQSHSPSSPKGFPLLGLV